MLESNSSGSPSRTKHQDILLASVGLLALFNWSTYNVGSEMIRKTLDVIILSNQLYLTEGNICTKGLTGVYWKRDYY